MRKSVHKMCDAVPLLPGCKSVSTLVCNQDLQFGYLLQLVNISVVQTQADH
jgi:hypothetical protein